MTKIPITLAAALLAGTASSALADGTLHWISSGPGGNHGGGVFSFTMEADSHGFSTGGWAGEQSEHGLGSTFQTFCIETAEFLSGAYYHGINSGTTVINGTADPNRFISGDMMPSAAFRSVLHAETAFLYSGFRSGETGFLSGVTGWGSDTAVQADAIQALIWLFQGQVGQNWINANYTGAEATLITNLKAFVLANSNNPYWAAGGNVRVMNLFTGNGTTGPGQSQLVLIPLPAETYMAGVGLVGLFGLGVLRRRRA